MTKKDIDYFVKKYTIDNYYTPNEISYRETDIEAAGFTVEQVQKAVAEYRTKNKKDVIKFYNAKFIIIEPPILHNDLVITNSFYLFFISLFNYPIKKYFSHHYILSEAFASSSIEGAISSIDTIAYILAKMQVPINNHEKMIINNFKAISAAVVYSKKPLTHEIIHKIHKIIMANLDLESKYIGTYRNEPLSVYTRSGSGKVVYEPKNSNHINQIMDELLNWANKKEKSLEANFCKAIIFHFIFAYIHPYMDGNGRTARILQMLLLLRYGLGYYAYLPISTSIFKYLQDYDAAFINIERNIDKQGNLDLTYFVYYITNLYNKLIKEMPTLISKTNEMQKQRKIKFNRGTKVTKRTLLNRITCPHCGFKKEEIMLPLDACLYFYECEKCKKMIKPKEGDCCIFCSYGTSKCFNQKGHIT